MSTSCRPQALYNATESPESLTLSEAEELSIGLVTTDGSQPGDFCSGTLVDPEWVLTAKHRQRGPSMRFRMPGQMPPGEVAESILVERHPVLDLLLFKIPRIVSGPLPILPSGQPSTEPLAVSTAVVLAGLGETEDGTVMDRRFLETTIARVTDESMTFDGAGRSGACFGDSGGPVLIARGGRIEVAGVLSKGSRSCVDLDVAVRTDTVADWLSRHLARPTVEPARRD